ncbi:trypsin-like peptidase domain-containing protein [Streptomyces sp. NPDC006798]|uniref:VMAP-C domain-containing protein n=1 Tax=Streptomyces sp. NPDC006798 TaxID=3155462 RepID=UPI0033DAF184
MSVRSTVDGKASGAGLLLAPDTVLTCAHVVNDALGRTMLDPRVPGAYEVPVVLGGGGGGGGEGDRAEYPARVAHWIPPRPVMGEGPVRSGAREWHGDLAVLRFTPPTVDAGGPTAGRRLADRTDMEAGQQVRLWHGSVKASTFADATVGDVGPYIGYVDGKSTGMAVDSGYSGGPMWSLDDLAFVGIVVAHFMPPTDAEGHPLPANPQQLIRRSWAVPWQRIETELRAVGALPPARPPQVEKDDPAQLLLTQALEDLMPSSSSRSEHGHRLARDLGMRGASEIAAPTAEEFARLLLQEPRSLAAFTESTRRRNPEETDRILAAGALSPVPKLLSAAEHRRLYRYLHETDRVVRARFGEAVRAALPMAAPLRATRRPGADAYGDGSGPDRAGGGAGAAAGPVNGTDSNGCGGGTAPEARTADGSVDGPADGPAGGDPADGWSDGRSDGATGWTPTLDELIDHLETLHGDSRTEADGPRVPALLRVVEYFATLCSPYQCAQFRIWSDSVAARLGIPRSALVERRADANEWKRVLGTRTGRVRVLVQVTPQGRDIEGRDLHRLRIWCDEGGGPRQVSTASTPLYTAPEAARELLRVLESLAPAAVAEQRPLVEVLVDPSGLNLPIDEWEGMSPGEIVPGVLGAEFPLVVHCPELLRRHERFLPDWRRRWQQLDSGTTVVFSNPGLDAREIYGTLMDQLDAVRVSVDVPAELRDKIVQVCLAVGVPVVVWDRERGDASHAVGQMAEAATRELPDVVRSYRAKTVRKPREYPGRPVLAWADADRTVPRLHLSEPVESA